MDSMKEAMNRRKMKGLELVISIQPQETEENKQTDLAPDFKKEEESEMPMEGEEMAMDGLPTEPPVHTRSLSGKVDAAKYAARMKKGVKA